jgi:hypothetical protein
MKKKDFTVICSKKTHGTRGECVDASATENYLHVTITPITTYPHQVFFEKSNSFAFSVYISGNPVIVSLPSKEGSNTIQWGISAKLNFYGNHNDDDVTCVAIPSTNNTKWEYKLPNTASPTTLSDTHITITAEEDIHPIE